MAVLSRESVRINDTHILHPFFNNRFDAAVLRDGVKPALRIGHSRRAAGQFLDNVDIPWDQQVAVMFKIVCVLALDVQEVLHGLEQLQGVPPKSFYLVSHGEI